LASKWNIKKLEDWNKVTNEMVVKEGGYFIKYYNNSLSKGTKDDRDSIATLYTDI
jgi:hypothetical protein